MLTATGRALRCRSVFWIVIRRLLTRTCMPKSVQPKAKAHLKDIWMAETKTQANAAFDAFVAAYGVKYDRAVKCLTKDRDDLLAFYDFPAEHWKGHQDDKPDRKHLRHRQASNHQNQRLPQPPVGTGDDPPADVVRQEEMAQTRWSEQTARNHPAA